ncbi:hypothetical protein [Lewinella sp. JB7]|uniref:hypothetical protein n=1 Tax=Lewinella sp. JB7 TaxID=2962887 RepID=UPI0020C9D016|nr:hypothetical protein [Lewinella sp. JB7]MCP9236929.1 hypothetical protein [Lewinella sp. JB7]
MRYLILLCAVVSLLTATVAAQAQYISANKTCRGTGEYRGATYTYRADLHARTYLPSSGSPTIGFAFDNFQLTALAYGDLTATAEYGFRPGITGGVDRVDVRADIIYGTGAAHYELSDLRMTGVISGPVYTRGLLPTAEGEKGRVRLRMLPGPEHLVPTMEIGACTVVPRRMSAAVDRVIDDLRRARGGVSIWIPGAPAVSAYPPLVPVWLTARARHRGGNGYVEENHLAGHGALGRMQAEVGAYISWEE